jgi:cytoskeletal protein CcmA (bactofilin family)
MATIIGSTMLIEGEIDGEERLVVQGTVQGKIKIEEAIEIARSGIVRAEIDAEALTVAGQIHGRVRARTKVELTSEAKMVGDIHAPRILIADGAHFKGNIDMD